MTLGEQVADLQARIRAAQEQQVRAQMHAQAAEAAAEAARDNLREQFGVRSAQDAQELLGRARTELNELIVSLTEALDQVQA